MLRNAIHTALTVEDATLFTILKLLQNDKFRKEVIKKLEDEDLIDFWKNELGKAGDMQKVKMAAGITAKIGRFNANTSARLILSQKKSTIDLEDIMNSGKILICNFSKGLLGEDVADLFGIAVLAKLQLASLRRARLKQSERRAFYLYVDEFQNFATPSLSSYSVRRESTVCSSRLPNNPPASKTTNKWSTSSWRTSARSFVLELATRKMSVCYCRCLVRL